MPKSNPLRSLTCLLLVTAAGLTTGCRKGPPSDALQTSISGRLDASFSKGLFSITDFTRRGHYPYAVEGDERPHVLVYWDAAVRFERDYVLSNWDELNVGSLITTLGATAQGVQGVSQSGNKKGDMLQVRGTSAFVQEADAWTPTTFSGPDSKTGGRSPTDKSELPYRKHLDTLSAIGARAHRRKNAALVDAITGELEAVARRAQLRQAESEGQLTIATGRPSGEYARQGTLMAQMMTQEGRKAMAHSTTGSIENCKLIEDGQVRFAYTQNDIASMAFEASHLFEGKLPMRNLRSLASLYPEAVQIVTLAKSGVTDLQSLRGKRVDIGLVGSGSRINAIEILKAAEISFLDLIHVQGSDPKSAIGDLLDGKIDAVFVTTTYPSAVISAAASKQALALVPLPTELITSLHAYQPYFLAMKVPSKTYEGLDRDTHTVGVTAMLVTQSDTPDSDVEAVLKGLFASSDGVARDSPQSYLISQSKAKVGISIPMHPAAERFLNGHSTK